MGWGLDLADLRAFALNSLRHSGMTDDQKADAIENKWQPKWDEYIQQKKEHACGLDLEPDDVTFARLFPREGALRGMTNVHVFGRHFEGAICREVRCKFGDFAATAGHYVSQNHLLCSAPDPEVDEELVVDVEVSLDGGDTFLPLNQTFTYKHEPFTTTLTTELTTTGAAAGKYGNTALVIAAVMLGWCSVWK